MVVTVVPSAARSAAASECVGASAAVGLGACPAPGRRAQQAGEGDSAQDGFLKCYRHAFEYCKAHTAMDACPGLGPRLKPKRPPVPAAAAPASEQLSLGVIEHDISLLNASECASGRGFDALLAMPPSRASGQLAPFRLRSEMGVDSAEEALSMPSVACVSPGEWPCTATRDDLDDALYDIWYEGGRDDVDYRGDPEIAMYLEGAYQAAVHVARWLVAPLSFEYTLLYNGSFWSPRLAGIFGGQFDIEMEPEVPSTYLAQTSCS